MNKIIAYKCEKLKAFTRLALAKKIYTTIEDKKFMENFILSGNTAIYCDSAKCLIECFVVDFFNKKAKDFDANDIEKLKKINATLSTCVKELEDVFGLEDDTDGQDKEDC